ncbi:uncharacterized protein LOC118755396, partial [Rhagoletis pomonella]|uniref:uncharacterized protein LOC118755396 n=2 Tax=Rhagoletis pomonella TaxID=28610 RepID=UPI0017861C00
MDISGNIFEESFDSQENTILPKKSYDALSDPHPETSASSQNDILKALREVLNGQKESNARLAKLEENQTTVMQNQAILSQGLASIVANQEEIAKELEKINISIEKNPEAMAQTKALRECKVAVRKIEMSVCRLTGELEDTFMNEVTSMLPLATTTGVLNVEERLQVQEFAQAMTSYLNKMKGTSEDVGPVIRGIFTDDLLHNYNWDGTWEKQALNKLNFINNILR